MSIIDCSVSSSDMRLFREKLLPLFSSPQSLPLSLQIGGKKIRGLSGLQTVKKTDFSDSSFFTVTYEGKDAAGLKIEVICKVYRDFPLLEWSTFIYNGGDKNTDIISNLYSCDCEFPLTDPVLYHCNGDICGRDGYKTEQTPLCDKILTFIPSDGRPSDGAYPYYRVLGKDFGYNIAIGWSGQWRADFSKSKNGFLLKAKQALTEFYLRPGERAMLPSITIQIFEGGFHRAVNIWRRWYFAHILPLCDGKRLTPLIFCHDSGKGEEFTLANEKQQLSAIEKYIERGMDFDVWWIDAGWYKCYVKEVDRKVWTRTGNWDCDEVRWPEEFKKVSALLKKHNKKFLLWFEPERASRWHIPDEFPQDFFYYLKRKEDNGNEYLDETALYKLGDKKARSHITEKFTKFLERNGVDIYRQDFNVGPLDWWLQNDEEGRKGLAENFHVQGYLKFWDDLRESNPNLFIDSCASGGRRNDIETMKRAVPLHYTDYGYGEHAVKQSFTYTVFQWTPFFRNHTLNWDSAEGKYVNYAAEKENLHKLPDNDNYAYHTAFAPCITCCASPDESDEVMNYCNEMNELWRKAAKYTLSGDYFPLTDYSKETDGYYALQFHDDATSSGVINAVRNRDCEEPFLTIFPYQIKDNSDYLFYCPEKDERFVSRGNKINSSGLRLKIKKRSGEFWFYREIKE